MRTHSRLALLLCGSLWSCQLLPSTEVECAKTDRCATPQTEIPPETVQNPFVLGQPDASTTWFTRGLNRPQGVAIIGGKLYVADTDDHRVLVWNTFPTESYQQADMVLGQEQAATEPNCCSYSPQYALIYPTRMASDGTRLVVTLDGSQTNRLVFYNTMPTMNYARNSFVFDGQSPPGAAGPRTFGGASALLAGGHLYLSDRFYNRMLMWDAIPTAVADASRAIGQTSFTATTANPGGINLAGFKGPDGAPSSDGTRMFVPDSQNHRVLAWNSLPTTNASADYVLGQASGMGNAPNRGSTPGLDTMNDPSSTSATAARLAVADRGNHRVLLWNTLPTATGQTADVVLGQSTTSGIMGNDGGPSGSVMNKPTGVATDGTHVAVADTENHRVLIWNSWPTVNGAAADVILGQSLPNNNVQNARYASPERFIFPTAVARAGNRLVVVDRDASRVLLWPVLPTLASQQPNIVLGQSDFTARTANGNDVVSAKVFDRPTDASSDGTTLAVTDTNNNRVLVWKTIPTQIQQPADLVLGQPDFGSDQYNNGGPMKGLDVPSGVFVRNGRIYVADTDNNRVLIWKTIPTQNQAAPDIVLGQADFSGISSNRGMGIGSGGLSRPTNVFADESHIYVSDPNNARVLVWNTIDPTNGQAADFVLGQPDFGSNSFSFPPSGASIITPARVEQFGSSLYLCDAAYHRVLIWNPLPNRTNQPATSVLGQSGLGGYGANKDGIDNRSLQQPTGILVTDIGIYIADSANHRVTVLPPTMQ